MTLILDAHLDLAWNALSWSRDLTRNVAEINCDEAHMTDSRARSRATTSLPEMRRGGVAACLGTLLARSRSGRPAEGFNRLNLDHPTAHIAHGAARGQLAYYRLLEEEGQVRMIGSAGELRDHWQSWERRRDEDLESATIGIILATEGADPIVTPAQAESLPQRQCPVSGFPELPRGGPRDCRTLRRRGAFCA
jgi:membrane dipeptidase